MPFSWKGRANVVIPLILVFCHLVLISIQVPKGSEQTLFQKVIFGAFSPVQRIAVSLIRGTEDSWNGFFRLRHIRSDNQRLKKEIFFLRQENGILQGLTGFLKGEKKMAADLAVLEKSIVAARIIGLDPSNYYRSLNINRGRLDGIRANQAVCDRHGNIVGRVTEPVTAHEARVQLVTDSESGVSVTTKGETKIVGILSGDSTGMCHMKYVLATVDGGAEGDELVTTGFDKIYPPGLRVGIVLRIEKDASLFKAIDVDPYFSFADLDIVAVIISDKVQGIY